MSRLENYKNIEKELATKLELQYEICIKTGDYASGFEILNRLVMFGLIKPTDKRLKYNYIKKVFIKAGVQIQDQELMKIQKNSIDYLPKWIYADLPYSFNTILMSHGHVYDESWSDKVYRSIVDEKSLPISFELINSPVLNAKVLDNITKIIKIETKNNVKKLINVTREELENGVVRVYSIEIKGNVVSRYKTIGYLVVYADDTVKADLIINTDVINHHYISLQDALSVLRDVASYTLKINVRILNDYQTQIHSNKEFLKISKSNIKDVEASRKE